MWPATRSESRSAAWLRVMSGRCIRPTRLSANVTCPTTVHDLILGGAERVARARGHRGDGVLVVPLVERDPPSHVVFRTRQGLRRHLAPGGPDSVQTLLTLRSPGVSRSPRPSRCRPAARRPGAGEEHQGVPSTSGSGRSVWPRPCRTRPIGPALMQGRRGGCGGPALATAGGPCPRSAPSSVAASVL